jgi:hypothetical protein
MSQFQGTVNATHRDILTFKLTGRRQPLQPSRRSMLRSDSAQCYTALFFNSLITILRTVLALIEYLKPLMAIGMTIFSIFKSSPLVSKNH